ncbi:MAG: hypothetical protein J5846_05265 [Desulfovibrio sp.]|nr:hypothetical protein [Desulfovibrio sp.]
MHTIHTKDQERYKAIVEDVTKIIVAHGLSFLESQAWTVYTTLLHNNHSQVLAQHILVSLAAKIPTELLSLLPAKGQSGASENTKIEHQELIKILTEKCFLNAEATSMLADFYTELFAPKTFAALKKQKGKGFQDFCKKNHEFEWEGSATWVTKFKTSFEYTANMTVIYKVEDKSKVKAAVSDLILENPYIAEEDLAEYFEKYLQEMLDDTFCDYINGDDYYEPVLDEYCFNVEDEINEFLSKYGLALVELTDFDAQALDE